MTPDELEEARRLIEGTGTQPNTFSSGTLSDPRWRFAPRLTLPPPQETPPNVTPFTGDSVIQPPAFPNALTPQSREERQHLDENWRNFLLPPPYHAGQAIGRFIRPPEDQYGTRERSVSDLLLGLGLFGSSIGGAALAPRIIPPSTSRVTGPFRFPRNVEPITPRTVPGVERTPFHYRRPDLSEAEAAYLTTRPDVPTIATPRNQNIRPEYRYQHNLDLQRERARRLEEHPFQIIEGGTNAPPPINIDQKALDTLNMLRRQQGMTELTMEQWRGIRSFLDNNLPPSGGENLRRTDIRHPLLQDINPARRETRYAGLRDPTAVLFPGGPERFARPPKFTGEARDAFRRTIIELRDPARSGGPLNLERMKRHFAEQGIDVSTGTIFNELKNMQTYRPITGRGGKPRSLNYDEVRKGFAEGASVTDLAKRFNVRDDAIYTALRGGREGIKRGRYLSDVRSEFGLTRTRRKPGEEQYREVRNPAETLLRPGATPFDRQAKPPQYVRTSFAPPIAKDLSGEQATSLNRIGDWLRRSNIGYQMHKNPSGTVYVHARHPNTGEVIEIRVARDGHIGLHHGEYIKRTNAEANLFDTGYRLRQARGESLPEQREFTRNVSGEPYAIPGALEDALSHRLSANPSGQWLISQGRERVLPAPIGRQPPLTEVPIRFGTGRKIVQTQEEAINELKRVTPTQPRPRFDEQLNLPFEIAPTTRRTLSLKPRQYRETRLGPEGVAEGVLFPGRTPIDRQSKPPQFTHLPPQYGGMPHLQRTKFDAVTNWLQQSGVPFRTRKAEGGTIYVQADDLLGKRLPMHEAGMRYAPVRRNTVEIRLTRDGHIGIDRGARPSEFFDTGTWLGQRAEQHYGGRNITPFNANISGEQYNNLNNLFDALSYRFSKNPQGQFLIPPGREYSATTVPLGRDLPRPRGPATTPGRQFDFIRTLDESSNPLGVPANIMSSVHDIILREVRRNRAGGPNINSIRASIRRAHDYIVDRDKIERYIARLQ